MLLVLAILLNNFQLPKNTHDLKQGVLVASVIENQKHDGTLLCKGVKYIPCCIQKLKL